MVRRPGWRIRHQRAEWPGPALHEDPELFFAEGPRGRGGRRRCCARAAGGAECLQGALERREPWGVWGGELLLRGVVVPRKRSARTSRKDAPGVGEQAA